MAVVLSGNLDDDVVLSQTNGQQPEGFVSRTNRSHGWCVVHGRSHGHNPEVDIDRDQQMEDDGVRDRSLEVILVRDGAGPKSHGGDDRNRDQQRPLAQILTPDSSWCLGLGLG